MNRPERSGVDRVLAWVLVPLAMLAMVPIALVAGVCLIIDKIRGVRAEGEPMLKRGDVITFKSAYITDRED